ncbi:hypothetical protein U1Q18_023485 [Sarracenia purpurea var. burkii]
MGLSPVSFDGPADSGTEAGSPAVREVEVPQTPSVQGLLQDTFVSENAVNDVVSKEIFDSEGEISDSGEEVSEDEGTELNSVDEAADQANKGKDGDETVGVTPVHELTGKKETPLGHALNGLTPIHLRATRM